MNRKACAKLPRFLWQRILKPRASTTIQLKIYLFSAPSASPRNVAASARSSTSVMVQWQRPLDNKDAELVRGYIVRYRIADYPGIEFTTINVTGGEKINTIVEDLIPWQQYEVQVCAFNDKGIGVYSRPVHVRTLE